MNVQRIGSNEVIGNTFGGGAVDDRIEQLEALRAQLSAKKRRLFQLQQQERRLSFDIASWRPKHFGNNICDRFE